MELLNYGLVMENLPCLCHCNLQSLTTSLRCNPLTHITIRIHMDKSILLAVLTLCACFQPCFAADYFVSINGFDTNPGTIGQPVKTISYARDLIQRSGKLKKEAIHVYLRAGTHYLPETVVFSASDSGTAEFPVTYASYEDEKAVLSGGMLLNLSWEAHENGVYRAKTATGLEIDQLFVNGQRQHMARYPNFDKNASPYNGAASDAFAPSRARNWNDPKGAFIHAMHRHHWGGYHYRISGKDEDDKVIFEGGWQNNRQMGMHEKHRMVENVYEELDASGEWYHDRTAGMLFYLPPSGMDLSESTVEAVRLKHLIELQGQARDPVKHIALRGLVLRHAARTFMETREPLLRSDWTIYRGGAVLFNGAQDCQILDCEFDQLGGNSVFVNKFNRRITIRGCHIHHGGASGICFVGDPASVRNPKFEYGQTQSYEHISKIRGPQTDEFPADCVVDDCLIHSMSVVEKQATGVQISMSKGITIRHCSIYDLGRAGINISEGTFGGHVIEFCDVFDTVRETGDHGSFNSWGRDRFWHLKNAPAEELPDLSGLDTEPTIIRNSRWRCDHGWDVDLDDGSSHYEIYNNLFLRGGLKLREGFHRKVYNNIAVNNSLHPHVWYSNSMDIVTGNIWMGAYRPAGGMPKDKWGNTVDRNLFTKLSDKDKFNEHGCDLNSIVGDPMFIDPDNGDYRVDDASPAFKIGFKNFPMDQFGVRKSSLRSIARTPVLADPIVKSSHSPNGSAFETTNAVWLGVRLSELEGAAFSAFGVSREQGGVAIQAVPPYTEAARVGLRSDDVIQSINDQTVSEMGSFLKAILTAGSKPLQLGVVRNQQPLNLSVPRHSYLQITSGDTADELPKPDLSIASKVTVTANRTTNNAPLGSLIDGNLSAGYGPVFSNGERNGAYKMDLGRLESLQAITSWSFRQNARAAQKLTLYGSRSATDPGWDLKTYTPIGSVIASDNASRFTAASLRAAEGQTLGEFRWIVWSVSPITKTAGGENTAFQELSVEIAPRP